MSFELQIVLKTTAILFSAGVLSLLLRRSSAAVRHAVWVLALLAVLAFPFASMLLPTVELPILPEHAPAIPTVVVDPPTVAEPIFFEPVVLPAAPAPEPEPTVAATWSWRQVLVVAWGLGALFVFSSWLRAVVDLRRLRRTSSAIESGDLVDVLTEVRRELGVTSRVQLRIATESLPPMTWGIFRHVILLPASVGDWSAVRRRLVLEHEMAHVRRRDGLGQFLAQVVCSLYWFNPLVWYASRRLHTECERACDDTVLRLGVEAADYADHLVDIARGLNSGFVRSAFSMAHPSQLKSRVLAILDAGIRRRRLSFLTGAVLATAGVLILSAAAVRVTAIAGIALPAFPLPAAPQAPAPQVEIKPLPTGDASVDGRVLSFGNNSPVKNAHVILNTDPVSESALVAVADDNGRFEFPKIAAGTYQLLATSDGYVRGAYGQRSPSGPGTPFALTAGQSLKSLVITMTPTGAISGKIRNRFGEPAANVAVRALRIAYQNGRRTLVPLQIARTNDLGDYRLYYLEPGQYVVSALPFEGPIPEAGTNGQIARLTVLPGMPMGIASPATITTAARALSSQGLMSAAELGETYVPLYFPGVADLAAATPIDIKAGANTSADFIISEVRAVQIRGQIRDATGQVVKGATVALVPQGEIPGLADRHGSVKDDGSFEFQGIPPGAYDLIATSGNIPPAVAAVPSGVAGAVIDRGTAPAAGAANDNRLIARTPLRIGSADVENVSLTLRPGFAINGRITFEGLAAAEAQAMTAGLSVQLTQGVGLSFENSSTAMALQRSRTFSMPGSVGTDGAFTITGAFPGVYRIAIRGAAKLPPGAFIKSARLDGKDVLNPRFNLEGESRGLLEIVVGTNPGVLQVTALDERRAPAKAATVVLIPDSDRSQRYEFYFKGVTDSSGKVKLESVPPGSYQAFAWDAIDDGAWWNPELLRRFEGQGKVVSVGAGASINVELQAIH